MSKVLLVIIAVFLSAQGLEVTTNRRAFLNKVASVSTVAATTACNFPLVVNADEGSNDFAYERRDRKGNKNAIVREDWWYLSGTLPPRKLDSLGADFDNPKWNTWGTCTESAAGNSCTYVALSQRIPTYSKYAFNVRLGASDFGKLGEILNSGSNIDWAIANSFLSDSTSGMPSPICDSLLKSLLMAGGLLTSPNYSGPPKELLVARFYINEVAFSVNELREAIAVRDETRAKMAWEFGRDSWNSYFAVVNKNISPKVGDKFEQLA